MKPSVLSFPSLVFRQKDMVKSFVWRDLAARYEGSLLGRLWPVVYPLLLLAIYHLVFATFLNLKFGGENPLVPGWSTTYFLLSGILPWLCFADTLGRSTNVVVENSNLIKKIAFPSELLPTFVACAQLVHFLISLGLFTLLYVVVNLTPLSGASFQDGATLVGHLVYLPIPILLQFVFSLGLGMLLAALNVFVRDLNQMMPVVILLWMLISPIFYPLAMVEKTARETGETWMLTFIQFNPVFHLLQMYRGVFPDEDVAFPWASCGIFAACSLVLFVVGYKFFVATKDQFPDEV